MESKYHQGRYVPRNPDKYAGDVGNIKFRSSWERKAMIFFDTNPGIIKWGSEEIIIPYVSPVDNRVHRYFTDMVVMYRTKTGEVKRALVEIKPLAQTQPPVPPKQRNSRRYLTEVKTYAVNQAKWDAAMRWCKEHNFEWMILTEKELGV